MYLKLRNFSITLITGYQKYLRPALPLCCRFEPSCSEYTKQAILKFGTIRGISKGLARILRCHPFCQRSGYDPLI